MHRDLEERDWEGVGVGGHMHRRGVLQARGVKGRLLSTRLLIVSEDDISAVCPDRPR